VGVSRTLRRRIALIGSHFKKSTDAIVFNFWIHAFHSETWIATDGRSEEGGFPRALDTLPPRCHEFRAPMRGLQMNIAAWLDEPRGFEKDPLRFGRREFVANRAGYIDSQALLAAQKSAGVRFDGLVGSVGSAAGSEQRL
jgi:hypothetical protein